MQALVATLVDTQALAETVAAAFVTGIGVTIIFSLGLFGASRFAELGREERTVSALLYGVMSLIAGFAFIAALVAGIIVMTQK